MSAKSAAVPASWTLQADPSDPLPSLKGPILAGSLVIAVAFGGFLAWGYGASLDSAAIAGGTVIVDTKRKTVSHLEGGILHSLLVKEGDVVKAGQPLVLLDDTRPRTELNQLKAQAIGLEARAARLRAEQRDDPAIAFPPELLTSAEPFVIDVLETERRLFARRKETKAGRIDIQRKRIEEFAAEAAAASAQTDASRRQKVLYEEQIASIQGLVDKGYATRAQLADLQTSYSAIVGDEGEHAAKRAQAEQARAGAELEIIGIETEWQSEVARELQDTQIQIQSVRDKMEQASEVLGRVQVRAPQDGIVADIQTRTPGGVVVAGQPILDIVPENEQLMVEAMIDPRDIDTVKPGQEVRVRLTAYTYGKVPPLDGTLTYVAADRTVDQQSRSSYFVVRATISEASLEQLPKVRLYPGMPAELQIKNQPRRAIDYLLSPITESFSKAFREE
ncbi:HlyD family type I secretion periplasmic adaptor subunit [Chthonobacter rhizosphaerae]|uniref:HlyD family type I secretion periplasmic adaptor subunit n=1 Tax=Chthonobacter rhizosphaerae TaxID=2735553 RepID=UPI0015EF46CF|nr:HlyD family type I secretion periplasmic adaptor subunit [Chthonobacter rhizosphaerae]